MKKFLQKMPRIKNAKLLVIMLVCCVMGTLAGKALNFFVTIADERYCVENVMVRVVARHEAKLGRHASLQLRLANTGNWPVENYVAEFSNYNVLRYERTRDSEGVNIDTEREGASITFDILDGTVLKPKTKEERTLRVSESVTEACDDCVAVVNNVRFISCETSGTLLAKLNYTINELLRYIGSFFLEGWSHSDTYSSA